MFGVGLRHQHFSYLEKLSYINVDFFEIISENFINTRGRPFEVLMRLREYYPICMHGVSLSIASTHSISKHYLLKLKELEKLVAPMIISDHLCFTGSENANLHNLLPFAYTEENLERIAIRATEVQEILGRQIIFENLSAYFTLKNSTMSESEFLNLLCQKSGCGILLDINNLFVNSINQKFDPYHWLLKIDFSYVKQIHLAGYSDFGTHLLDTHSRPVQDGVWEIYKRISKNIKNIPVLIEWDEEIPSFEILQNEAMLAKAFQEKF